MNVELYFGNAFTHRGLNPLAIFASSAVNLLATVFRSD